VRKKEERKLKCERRRKRGKKTGHFKLNCANISITAPKARMKTIIVRMGGRCWDMVSSQVTIQTPKFM
jgi:hypothetical protein